MIDLTFHFNASSISCTVGFLIFIISHGTIDTEMGFYSRLEVKIQYWDKTVMEASLDSIQFKSNHIIARHNIEPAHLSLRLVFPDLHPQRSFERVYCVSDLRPGYTSHRIQLGRPTAAALSCVCHRSLTIVHSSQCERVNS